MLRPEHEAAIAAYGEFWLERVAERSKVEALTGNLYHYTPDIFGVEDILSTCLMRFGDVRYLNDPRELRYSMRVFRKVARARAKVKDPLVRNFLKVPSEPGFEKRLFDQFKFYTASFGRRDSAHMWRRYAGGGRGFAIGVASSLFAQKDIATIPYGERYFTGRVRYQQTRVRTLHREALDKAIGLVRGVPLDDAGAVCREFLSKLSLEVYVDLVVTSLTSKERRWSLEDEHRLYVVEDQDWPNLRKVFRPERPYIKMDIPKAAFVEIMLGPNTTASDRAAIEKIISDNGYGASVLISESIRRR